MLHHRSGPSAFSPLIAATLACSFFTQAAASELLVADQDAYRDALKRAEPGDEIVLADGEWRDFQIVFEAEGEEDAPITLRAETPGEVVLTGQSNLRIGGEHLVVRGLTFRDGYSPTDEVVSFRRDSDTLSHHVRFTENVIENFNKPERAEQDSWVVLFGQNNQVDHNAFLGKTNKGPTMIVRLSTEESQDNGHLIEHNFFGGRPPLGGNGGETLRIGVSQTSRTMSNTVVRRNYFERCDGEVEIISIKSQGNLITENVFYESRGSVVFRHGGQNEVSRNVFLGNGVPDTGGIRVINDNQVVRDNYLEGLRGQKFLGALVIMNGVPNSPENRYHQVENAEIRGNSFVDIAHVGLGVGSDEERSAVPIDSTVADNLFLSDERNPLGVFDDIGGLSFTENWTNNDAFSRLGFNMLGDYRLERAENGLAYVEDADNRGRLGAPRDLEPVAREDTGPSHYQKAPQSRASGPTITVGARERELRRAIEAAEPGTTIEVAAGTLRLRRPITIDSPLTITGAGGPQGGERTMLRSSADGLFILKAGAKLTLRDMALEQRSSDTALFHAEGERYEGDYALNLRNVSAMAAERVSEAAPLIAADPNTFASAIELDRLNVSRWPGALIDLSGDGLEGWYLSDEIEVRNSRFENVGGPLVRFGREGRDESTFGPRFVLKGSDLSAVGASGRALELQGVDGLRIADNDIAGSGDLAIKRRVLGFPFVIDSNDMDEGTDLSVSGVEGEELDPEQLKGDK